MSEDLTQTLQDQFDRLSASIRLWNGVVLAVELLERESKKTTPVKKKIES